MRDSYPKLPVSAAGEEVRIGSVLHGKYRIERVLGQGGMGVVVGATHLQLEQPVAIKFLRADAMNSPDAITRFTREARAAATIKNEHVARVLDVGSLPSGAPFMVMEYLDGRDLDDVLADEKRLPVPDAVDYILQACEALAEAHAFGIVHRDLKPANLFRARRTDGSLIIKILDFGISKIRSSASDPRASMHPMEIVGSPAYMSPEQILNPAAVDGRADVWGLGIILYELVTGRAPFEAAEVPDLCDLVLKAPVRWSDEIPPRLFEVMQRALEKDRERRYANIGQLAQALAEFAPRHSQRSIETIARLHEVTPGAPPLLDARAESALDDMARVHAAQSRGAQTVVSMARLNDTRGARPWLWMLALVVFAGAGGTIYLQRHRIRMTKAEPPPSSLGAASSVALPVAPLTSTDEPDMPVLPPTATTVAASASASSSASGVPVPPRSPRSPASPPSPARPRAPASAMTTEPEPKPVSTDNSAFGPRQ